MGDGWEIKVIAWDGGSAFIKMLHYGIEKPEEVTWFLSPDELAHLLNRVKPYSVELEQAPTDSGKGE